MNNIKNNLIRKHYDHEAIGKFTPVTILYNALSVAEHFLRYLVIQKKDWPTYRSSLLKDFNQRTENIRGELFKDYIDLVPISVSNRELAVCISKFIEKTLGIENLSTADLIYKQDIKVTNVLRSSLHVSYFFAKNLESIMTAEESKTFWMNFIDHLTMSRASDENVKKPKDTLISSAPGNPFFEGSFDLSEAELEDGRAVFKISKCKWNEILKECEDPTYGYAVACHYDFEAFKKANKNFVLTRNQTLLAGGSFCDFCVHDKSEEKIITHPDENFWKKI